MKAHWTTLGGTLVSLFLAAEAAAGWVRTVDGQWIEGEVGLGENGSLVVRRQGAAPLSVPLARVARVTVPDTGGAPVYGGFDAEGWVAGDVGGVGVAGSTGCLDGKWCLHGGGGDIGGQADGCHFVSTRLEGNCQLLARVTRVASSDRQGSVGIMLRETRRDRSRFAALLVKADGTLSFRGRTEWGKSAEIKVTQPAPAPVWIKLRKDQHDIDAFKSADGRQWQPLGRMRVPMARECEAGLTVANRNAGSPCTGWLDNMELTANGLQGEYFAEPSLAHPRFVRVDSKIDWAWGLGAPDERLGKDQFAVRWTGQVEPRRTEPHHFHWDADDTAQLWIDGRPMPRLPLKKDAARERAGMPLQAGQRYGLRLEYREGGGSASVRLGWSSPSQAMEIIPATRFFRPVIPQIKAHVEAAAAASRPVPLSRGILLRSGTFLSGAIAALDERQIKLRQPNGKELSLLWHQLAWIVFRPPREAVALADLGARTGVLLQNGEWFEGDIRGITSRKLTVSSVLHGVRHFHHEQADVAAWLLQPLRAAAASFEIHMTDGSVLMAQNLTVAPDALVMAEPTLGDLRTALAAIREINRRP
ncbi:MAG: hypothetical protein JXQ71_12530 [Verrucomicrobia bacterium]|nr:hypothetical protein [Verrucomicrobiota bacterium]